MTNKYDQKNIFAKIISGDIPSDKVYEDEDVLAFNDISKAAPKHVLIIPKGQYVDLGDFVDKAGDLQVANFFRKVHKIAKDLGLKESGYRIIANSGKNASQTVFHFHVHIIGGRPLGGLLPNDNLIR